MRIKNFVQLFAAAAALTLTLSIGVTALAVSNTGTNQSAPVYYKITTKTGSTVDRVYDVSLASAFYTINGTQYVNESIDANGKIVNNTKESWGETGVTIMNNGKLAVHVDIELTDGAISLTANKTGGKDLAPGGYYTVDISSDAKMDDLTIDGQSHEAGSITLVLSEISETNS